MRRKRIGYDLDGTIAPRRQSKLLDIMWWLDESIGSFFAHYRLGKPRFIPPKNAVIITGRTGRLYNETVRWLRQYKISNELFLNFTNHTNNIEAGIKWKIFNINQLKLTDFYDDNWQTIRILRKETEAKIHKIRK